MKMERNTSILSWLIAVPLVSFICFAQAGIAEETGTTVEETEDEATIAFQTGKVLFHDKEFAAAADEFRRANELRPNWKLLYNIGQSEAAAKRFGLAVEAFEKYLVLGGDEIESTRCDELLEEIRKFREIVGALEIKAEAGLLIIVDDTERGTTPLSGPILIAAGIEHHVAAMRDDTPVFEQRLRVNGEQQKILEIQTTTPKSDTSANEAASQTTTSAEPPPAVSPSKQDKSPSPLKPVGWSLLGAGAGTLIAAMVTGGIVLSIDNDLENDCEPDGCPPGKVEKRNQMNRLALTTDILIGCGAVLAASGIILWVIGNSTQKNENRRTVSLRPSLSDSQASLILIKKF